MIAIGIFMITIAGLCFFFSVKQGVAFESILPVSIASKVLVLFIFGIAGSLLLGVYIILISSIIEYCAGLYLLLKKKNKIIGFFTEGLVLWIVSAMLIIWCMYGKMFDSWDEFSHWGDIVKVFVTIDDFGTNPNSFSEFKTYPPGMTLFQYYLQKLNIIILGKQFTEWMVYFAYQLFVVSFIIPIVCKFKTKNNPIIFFIMSIIIIMIGPLLFGEGIFRYIYIDPVIGVLFACGLAEILYPNEDKHLFLAYVASICSMLTLSKDAGLLFSAFLCVAFSLSILGMRHTKKGKIEYGLFCIGSAFLPKIIWNYHLKKKNAIGNFSGKYDFRDFYYIVTRKKVSYRTDVCRCFKQLFFTTKIEICGLSIPTYLFIMVVFCTICLLVIIQYKKATIRDLSASVVIIIVGVTSVIYILGMLLSYMYKFSEYEALYCASFLRYLYILFESIWMLFLFVLFSFISQVKLKKKAATVLFLLIIITVSPKVNLTANYTRQSVKSSISFRSQYSDVVNAIENNKDIRRVFLVSQGNDGMDFWILKYSIRPKYMNNRTWSFGDLTYEGDIYTKNYSVKEIQEEWVKDKYDHVLIFRINEELCKKYKDLFVNSKDIGERKIYTINDKNKLELCNVK